MEDMVLNDEQNQDSRVVDAGEISSQSLSTINISESLSRSGKPLLVASTSETCFSHLNCASFYCINHLERLQRHAVVSMELKLTQECLKRLVCVVKFTKKLETYAEHEISRLDGIHRHEFSKSNGCSLEYYHKLCNDAKIHLDHWQHLGYKAKRQIRSCSQSLTVLNRMERFKQCFLSLKRQILFWLSRIALTGLRTMANASFKQLSSTADLQNFLQGIEEFNHTLSSSLRQSKQQQGLYEAPDKRVCLGAFFKYSLCSLNIVDILATVCIERAHLLARLTHEQFTREAKAIELQDFLSITRFSWAFENHLSSSDLLECTANVCYGKLQSVIKKYVHKDEEFIKQLLNTASVCVYLHHENERKKSSNICQRHLQLTNCQCNLTPKCWTCQESDSSIKAITDGSDYGSEYGVLHESFPLVQPVNQDRRALFMESRQTLLKTQLCSIYSNNLWERFALQFSNCLQSLQWPYPKDTSIGPVCCWSTTVLMGITQHLDNLASTGPFSEIGAQSVRLVSHSLYLNSVLASLDNLHCLMIAVGQTDKCKPTNVIDCVPSMKTTSLMVKACSIFQHFFSTASHWKEFKLEETSLSSSSSCNTLSVRIEDVFDRFSAFLSYCIFWFTTKLKHFLAGCNLSAFLVVSQYELDILMRSVNTTLQLMEGISCQMGNGCSWAVDVKHLWDEMERKAGYLQVIEVQSWENFKQKFITMASEFWQEMMPKGRIWKRSRNSGNLPNEPSSYVEHAIIQVLQPVIEGVSLLPLGLQNHILIQAVEIMMDTWSSHILKEEIKFSVIGAYQLQVDFNYVKLWLTSETSTLNSSLQSDLAILDVFRQLNEAVHLLLIQPKKRKMIKATENGVEQDMASNSSTISGSSVLSTNSSCDGELEFLNNRLIPNREQWLNLRLRNGKPRIPLVIPACLRAAEQT